MTKIFLIYLAGVAWGVISGHITFFFARRADRKFIEQLYERIETLAGEKNMWRKVAADRLPGRRPAA